MSRGLAGSVRWAVVPYVPAAPFRLYAGAGADPVELPDARSLFTAARRGGDPELSYIVAGKVRPVLLLGDPPDVHHEEVVGLRLLRLSRLPPEEQELVRRGDEELLVYLPPERFALAEESAAMVTALVRMHVSAIDDGVALGTLDRQEAARVGEAVIRYYGFDATRLVERRIRELAERRRQR